MRLSKTQRLLYRAQKMLCGPLITYWNSEHGQITNNDAEAFRALLSGTPVDDTIFLCLTSTGGHGMASLRIANLFRGRCRRLVVLVPEWAQSAATLIALSADEIHLAPHANLSPVDTSIHHALGPVNQTNDQVSVGQDELSRIMSLWRNECRSKGSNPYADLWHYIHPLVIGALDRANSLSLMLCDTLLAYHMSDSTKRKRRKIAETLTTAYPAHSYPILLPEARRIGLPAREMNPDIENVLVELEECYYEAGKMKRTDQDENHHHDDEIPTITERDGRAVYYRVDTDWYYRNEEKRWMPMNGSNGWYAAELRRGNIEERQLHIQ